ncbi:hypothetical protein Poli38472_013304 [Pythium oligandrum]|uniref:Uncharacterized protein n=1 Tax=Pythium oligandrum TaxID=41045 RepID=A0A8K1C2T5_PYTOL|nr:hypothetical protein Poli38472_013304 [Pythium oligandrum]|eukprot:TMW55413.1 hypothetical protein Poli38472_013304 [Pythium oligandrum]
MAVLLLAGAAALALALLTTLTILAIRLVLWFSLSYTLATALMGLGYWFVVSRRKGVAKGFYSCQSAPETPVTTPATTTTMQQGVKYVKPRARVETKENRPHVQETTTEKNEDVITETTPAVVDPEDIEKELTRRGDPLSATESEEDARGTGDDSGSNDEEVPVYALPPETPEQMDSPLPSLQRKRRLTPSQSVPMMKVKNANEASAPITRSVAPTSSHRHSQSQRVLQREQRQVKKAMEADGYWIGDFRVPPPVRSRPRPPTIPQPLSEDAF